MPWDTPSSPDYAAQAQAQGQANMDTARFNAVANRPNEYDVTGSRVWATDPNNPDRQTVTTTLSPEQRALYDLSTALKQRGLQTLSNNYGNIEQALGGGYTVPGQVSTGIDKSFLPPGGIAQDMTAGLAATGYGPYQKDVNFNATGAAMPTADQATRQAVTEALYRNQSQYLDPQFAQKKNELETQLRNEGIGPGTPAYETAMQQFGDTSQKAYSDARNQAITGGGEEMARDFGLGMSRRQQASNEALQAGTFHNAANSQTFNDALQRFQFWNSAQNQGFNQGLSSAQLNNAGRAQALNELAQSRMIPINVMNALLTQGQVSQPNFQPYNNNIQASPPPLFDAALAQGQFNIGQSNANNALWGSLLSGGSNLAGGAIRGWGGLFGM